MSPAIHEGGPGQTPDTPLEAAAYWFDLFDSDEATEADRAAFALWINADPSHRDAWARVKLAWEGAGAVKADPQVIALRERADAERVRDRRLAWSAGLAGVAASLILAFGVGSLWFGSYPSAPEAGLDVANMASAAEQRFETAIGERSTMTLDDGSIVTLNTATTVTVAYEEAQRFVRLDAGQAIFDVAHDPDRPFTVEAGGQWITALGTAFDVRVDAVDGVQVSMIEGDVEIVPAEPLAGFDPADTEGRDPGADPAPSRPAVRLGAGEQMIAEADSEPEITTANLAQITSWREGRLIFEDEPLLSAVAEVNRYSRVEIVLASPDLNDLRVSGVFDAGRSTGFAEVVASFYGLEMALEGGERTQLVLRR